MFFFNLEIQVANFFFLFCLSIFIICAMILWFIFFPIRLIDICYLIKRQDSKQQQQKQEPVIPSKFYPKKPDTEQLQQLQQKCSVSVSKLDHHQQKQQKQTNRQKNQLDTWQADVQSQLLLPQDFTPELIAQLAAEGYDLTSGASRKARSRQQSTLANSVNAIEDSSDEENEHELSQVTGRSSKQQGTGGSSGGSRLVKGTVKYDGEDPNENPSFKRFNQILGVY